MKKEEETAQTVGYITGISSNIINFSEKSNDKQVTLMFEMKEVDSDIKSKLKVGQKVRITYSLPLKYSSPPMATPIEFDIIEE